MTDTVRPDSLIRVNYRILDFEGNELEGTEGDEDVVVELGVEVLPAEVELALVGKKVGDAIRIELDQPYGDEDPSQYHSIPRDAFEGEIEAQPGDWIPLVLEPESPEEGEEPEEIEVRLVEINDDGLVVDLNHPYAGMDLVYEVRIVGLED